MMLMSLLHDAHNSWKEALELFCVSYFNGGYKRPSGLNPCLCERRQSRKDCLVRRLKAFFAPSECRLTKWCGRRLFPPLLYIIFSAHFGRPSRLKGMPAEPRENTFPCCTECSRTVFRFPIFQITTCKESISTVYPSLKYGSMATAWNATEMTCPRL